MDWLQPLALLAALAIMTAPLGGYMARVYRGQSRWLRPLETLCYRLAGIDEHHEQRWTEYAASVLAFGLVGIVSLFALLRLQALLPLNPRKIAGMPPDLAFNTAISFVTNTSWQSYTGESALGYLAQMMGIAVQSFLSCATSMAVAVALFRAMASRGSATIGNFWVDMTRSVLYILLPISLVGAILFASQGVIQNFRPYVSAATPEMRMQTIPQGPVASQESVKMLSANGGGFFNANSAHPYENPTPLSNFISLFLMMLLPASLTFTFGRMVHDIRQGWALFVAMTLLFLLGFAAMNAAESHAGGNWEGKESRFGVAASALGATACTTTSSGAMNSSHSSYMPLGVLVQMVNMHTGEVIFGGPGSGMYSMILVVLFTVFIAGLMVGRTPDYLGKKIERHEVQMVVLALILASAMLLLLTAGNFMAHLHRGGYWNPPGRATTNFTEQSPHGFSEALYALSSAVANNGSAMAGLNANTPWYNLLLGVAMLGGRYIVILPVLAIAGSLAAKRRLSIAGSMPTHGPVFVLLLIGAILLVTAVTFLPSLFLGPIAEQFRV